MRLGTNDAFSAVARTLAREGFRGRINNHSLSRTTTIRLPAAKEYVRLPQKEVVVDQEWLRFNHIPRRGLIYPERLRVEYPVAFDLILPGPATIPLVHMLEEYSKLVPAFHHLVSISYFWCHSLGMREISPTCLALLFISFLQVRSYSIFPLLLSEIDIQETIGIPGITFPTSAISDYNAKQYHLSKTGGKWAVHKISLGNDQWTDEIVALETEFMMQTDAKCADLDKSRLLRDFMKFVFRNSAHAMGLIFSTQLPQWCLQKLQDFYRLCGLRGEDFKRFGTLPGSYSRIAPRLAVQVDRCPLRFDATPSTVANPPSDHPRSFHVYPRQWIYRSTPC